MTAAAAAAAKLLTLVHYRHHTSHNTHVRGQGPGGPPSLPLLVAEGQATLKHEQPHGCVHTKFTTPACWPEEPTETKRGCDVL